MQAKKIKPLTKVTKESPFLRALSAGVAGARGSGYAGLECTVVAATSCYERAAGYAEEVKASGREATVVYATGEAGSLKHWVVLVWAQAEAEAPQAAPDRPLRRASSTADTGGMPPARDRHEALRRLLRARAALWERCVGQDADEAYREALMRATNGRTGSSREATASELGAAVDAVADELWALGYSEEVQAADEAYEDRQRTRGVAA